jgi:predicted TIM-barrel fold metal-dependent hydrolase
MAESSRDVRRSLDHPVLDVDGHVIEFMPAVLPYLREALGPKLFDRYVNEPSPIAKILGADVQTRIRQRTPQSAWWGTPAENTRDLATGALPGLLYERFEELGLDYSVLYPTKGFGIAGIADQDMRIGVCRGFNMFYADVYGAYRDRMTAAGVIPMHTPEEAIAELEHCKQLGLKAIGFPEGVIRPITEPQLDNPTPFLFPGQTHYFDWYGIDSAYDYDPVWAKAQELGFAGMFHGGLGHMPSGSFTAVTNYTFNHIGSFAHRMHYLCKSLYMGGVTNRFPGLNFGFLECGVGWATILLCDILEHWEKRNMDDLQRLDPAKIDWDQMAGLFASHGKDLLEKAGDIDLATAMRALPGAGTPPDNPDEWRFVDIADKRDAVDKFVDNFYFGCEADDRTIAFAFAPGNPLGARLKPVFSSDLSHWDVPDMAEVVEEAHGLVRKGVLTEQDFREFVFENPARLLLRQNPDFFVGTAAEASTRQLADEARAAKGVPA